MEDFCQYNLFRKSRPPLFIPPPYVRKSEGHCETIRTPTLHLRASDPSKILLLCESLKDQCTLDLEAKINCYLMNEGECDCSFMCSYQVLPNTAVINVIGVHALDPEIQIPSSDPALVNIIRNKEGSHMSVDNLPTSILAQLRVLKPDFDGEVSAYPIFEQKHKNGITEITSNISHTVFIINSTHQKVFLGHLVHECYRFALPILANTAAFERQTKIKARMQELVLIGQDLFNNINDKEALLEYIVDKAKSFFESERCELYFLDKKQKSLEGNTICDGKVIPEIVPKNRGILGYVYTEKKLLNLCKPQENPLFVKSDDDRCKYTTRNILCFPIPIANEVLGCGIIRNKLNGDFNVYDENAVTFFGQFAALAVHHANALKELRGEQTRREIANKLMLYEFEFRDADVSHLLNAVRPKLPGFDFPTFNARTVPPHRLNLAVMMMFEKMGFIQEFQLERRRLAKFLVFIEKGYHYHPFHNFAHAFSVAHFIYSTITYLELLQKKILSKLEAMALLIAAICHDVDHKGIPYSWRTLEDSTFASLYTSEHSIMEMHHFMQTMTILNCEGCNFLVNLPPDDYATCLELIKHNIKATDYLEHLRHCKKQEILLSRTFRPRLMEHKLLFCSLLMTCGDFSEQLYDWRTVRNVAAQMYEEYFHVSDLEKEMGKIPVELMDRDKLRIPTMQIEFLKDVCMPPFQLLVRVFPDMHFTLDTLYETITNWELSKVHFLNREVDVVNSIELLTTRALSYTNLVPTTEEYGQEDSYSDNN